MEQKQKDEALRKSLLVRSMSGHARRMTYRDVGEPQRLDSFGPK